MRTRVKICGVTNVEDALLASRAGADAVGLIQVRGAKRYVDVATAAEIVGVLPAFVTPVLVFADASLEEMRNVVRVTGVRTVQLHGHEPVEVALGLHGVSVVKRLEVGLTLGAELEQWSLLSSSVLAGVLLEGPGRGGTGTGTDWDALDRVLEELAQRGLGRDVLPPLILAGGVSPENVGGLVRRFRPWGVDVSSGVENPAVERRKDLGRVEGFVAEVRVADGPGAEYQG